MSTAIVEKPSYSHRSVSQLLSYSKCGEAFRLERVAKAPQRPAGWFVQGIAVHAALEEWERGKRTTSRTDLHDLYLDEYRTMANKLIEKHPDESTWMTGGRKKGFVDLTDRENLGWWQVENYIEWALSESELWRVAEVETKFSVTLGGVEVIGFIDQITEWRNGARTPADLKTGNSLPPSPIQLIVYGAAMEEMGIERVTMGDWIKMGRPATARGKQKDVLREVVDFTTSPVHQREVLDQLFADLDRGINAGIYLPNPQDGCDRVCGVSAFCRAMSGSPQAANHYSAGLVPVQIDPEVRTAETPSPWE